MIGRLVASLVMDQKQWGSGLKAARSEFGGFLGFVNNHAGKIATSIAGAFAVKDLIENARDAQQAERKLQGALSATGGTVGLTADEIKKYASELESLTNFEDDATVAAAATLLAFKNIRGDQFKDALALAQDLAAGLDGDLKGAVLKVGKALNDPEKGLKALSKVGVKFTADQAKLIEKLQQSGNILGAQKIIIEGLKGSYGGLAQSVTDPIKQIENTFGNIKETLGGFLLPDLNSLAKTLKDQINPLTESDGALAAWGETAKGQIDVIGALHASVAFLADGWQFLRNQFREGQADATLLLKALLQLDKFTNKSIRQTLREGGLQVPKGKEEEWDELRDAMIADLDKLEKEQRATADALTKQPWNSEKVDAFFKKVHENLEKTKRDAAGLGGPKGFVPPIEQDDDEPDNIDKLKKEAEALKKSTRTPLEEFQDEHKKLQELFGRNLIGDETLERGLRDAIEKLKRDAGDKFDKEVRPGLEGMLRSKGLDSSSVDALLDEKKPLSNKLASAATLQSAEGQRAFLNSVLSSKFGAPSTKKATEETAKNTREMAKAFASFAREVKTQNARNNAGDGGAVPQIAQRDF